MVGVPHASAGTHWRFAGLDVLAWVVRFNLTHSINQRVLASQIPHKIVNLLFDDVFVDFKSTIL
jgi:hypothetical protein